MIRKKYTSVSSAVADIPDGATVMIGGFGASGSPIELIHALIDQGAKNLTVINNRIVNRVNRVDHITGIANNFLYMFIVMFNTHKNTSTARPNPSLYIIQYVTSGSIDGIIIHFS